MSSPLLTPFHNDRLSLPNRIAMAPMTRSRADDASGEPTPEMATYYAQRASAGLLVSEGIWPHRSGKGGPRVPGLTTDAHVAGWKPVTEEIHAAGGRVFAQLWHVGRVNHPDNLDGALPPAPSAVGIRDGGVRVESGVTPPVTPRAMDRDEIGEIIASFAGAARRAVDAGFDGVEIHGANGYLIQQFLGSNTNLRDDAYGDPIRFATEVTEAVVAEVGSARVGLRVSPDNPENDVFESDPQRIYRSLIDALNPLELAYLHVIERGDYPALADLRPRWRGPLIANYNGPQPMTREQGESLLRSDLADIVSYGRLFISNPDLPRRFATDAPLNAHRHGHRYDGGGTGYIDYPALETAGA